jgi:hypothetical protein
MCSAHMRISPEPNRIRRTRSHVSLKVNIAQKIEAAFRSLSIHPEIERRIASEFGMTVDDRIASMVSALENLPSSVKRNPSFEDIGHKTTKKELKDLAKKAQELAKCLASLHKPAIVALANVPKPLLYRRELKELATHISEAASEAASGLASDTASHDDSSKMSKKKGRGRTPNRLAIGIARILAFDYEELTGKPPTIRTLNGKAYGPFLNLVTDVFNALGLEARPEAMAKKAITLTADARATRFPKSEIPTPK